MHTAELIAAVVPLFASGTGTPGIAVSTQMQFAVGPGDVSVGKP